MEILGIVSILQKLIIFGMKLMIKNYMTENEAINQLEQYGIFITYKIIKYSMNKHAKISKKHKNLMHRI